MAVSDETREAKVIGKRACFLAFAKHLRLIMRVMLTKTA
jgi:hypothetical protein